MRYIRIMVWLLLFACSEPEKVSEQDWGDAVDLRAMVDPFIATGGIGYSVGCAYPGAAMPLGMVKLSPDTADGQGSSPGFHRGGGYHYDDVYIEGFSHMHLHGIGLTDYGLLALMPTDGMSAEKTTRNGYAQPFSHADEHAEPGLYTVDLPVADVRLSVTKRTGLHEYRFKSNDKTIIVDLGHSLGRGEVKLAELSILEAGQKLTGKIELRGEMSRRFPMHFAIEFDSQPTGLGVWTNNGLEEGALTLNTEGDDVSAGAYFNFESQTVRARVGLSNVDINGALANLAAEQSGFDIDDTAASAKAAWDEALSVVDIWGGTRRDQRIFATGLYHALQMPTLFSDVDGRYRGFDGVVHTSERPFYTDFSLWDTYRTAHPLYTALWPDIHRDLLWSLAQMSLQGGGLPRWPLANQDTGVMLGTSANIVISEAVQKGITGFNETEFLSFSTDAMLGRTSLNFGAPPDVSVFEALGYYPADEFGSSTAWTQEQAIADHALGVWLAAEGEDDDGERLLLRGDSWKNTYNTETGFFHGRNRDGTFTTLGSEAYWSDEFTEGNARQYRWLAPHDPEGLFDTLGGKEKSIELLDELFEGMLAENGGNPALPENWYWHGNEPGLHIPWLFALAGEPEKTIQWTDWIMDNRYNDSPDGLAGNDDGGTLSSWFVFAAMGMYPLAGTDRYVLGRPRFNRIDIKALDATISWDGSSNVDRIVLGDEIWPTRDFRHAQWSNIDYSGSD